jgi:hypothetical protein
MHEAILERREFESQEPSIVFSVPFKGTCIIKKFNVGNYT